MNNKWPKKYWYPVFIVAVIVTIFLGILIQSLPFYDIDNFEFGSIRSIKINDRGLSGNNKIEIKDYETIQEIGRLIKSSTKVNHSDVNWKATQGLCDVYLIYRNNRIKQITVSHAIFNGGIVRSGQFCYRNDSLLSVIIQLLKNKALKAKTILPRNIRVMHLIICCL